MLRKLAVTAVLATTVAAAMPAQAASFDARSLMRSFNAIVLNDLDTQVETEGAVYVGGDYVGGATVNSDNSPDVDLGNGIKGSLIVGGSFTGNHINLESGDAFFGGSINGNVNNNGGGVISTGVSGIPVNDIKTMMIDFSAELAALAPTGGVANVTDNNNIGFIANPDANNVAVFNIDDTGLKNAGTYFGVTADLGVTTVINVSGKHIDSRLNLNLTQNSVIFNFYEAETLNIHAAFNASILAPLADLVLTGGGVNGTLVANNLNQDSEIRAPLYNGVIPVTSVPLPTPILMLLTALGALGVASQRRRLLA
ncbi:MAG: choice-of-anchor A family protein [Alphaproteobacteria bacterium]